MLGVVLCCVVLCCVVVCCVVLCCVVLCCVVLCCVVLCCVVLCCVVLCCVVLCCVVLCCVVLCCVVLCRAFYRNKKTSGATRNHGPPPLPGRCAFELNNRTACCRTKNEIVGLWILPLCPCSLDHMMMVVANASIGTISSPCTYVCHVYVIRLIREGRMAFEWALEPTMFPCNRVHVSRLQLCAQNCDPPPPNPYISETAFSHRFRKAYTYPPQENDSLVH